MKSIQWQLLAGLLGGILLATSLAGWGIYHTARDEANKLFDYHLQQAALSLPSKPDTTAIPPTEEEFDEDIIIQVWNQQDNLIYTSNPDFSLPHYKQQGFQTIEAFEENWRIYSENRRENLIQIAQPESVRSVLAADLALHSLMPFAWLMPILLLLVSWIVRRSLRPLESMAEAIQQRSPQDLQPLPTGQLPSELATITAALNDLLSRLEQALTAQRNFVADAAHELRSPLTALKLQLQLAERAKTDTSRTQAVAKLGERLNRAIHLVEQMLTLARHETGLPIAPLETVDLAALLVQSCNDYLTMADSQQVRLSLNLPDQTLTIAGYWPALILLLKNLLENALHYTPAGGHITLGAHLRETHPILSVTDTGIGIPVEERERVFDRFYRGADNPAIGTGLGLAIVKNIALQHQARIVLVDNPEGKGTCISIIFPAIKK